MSGFTAGHCTRCGEAALVGPLHGDRGGPITCIPCGLDVHADIRRSERREKLRARLFRLEMSTLGGDTECARDDELSLDLLEQAVRLTHPDRHPAERAALAAQVTADLLALKPFCLPKPKPRNDSVVVPRVTSNPDVTKTRGLLAKHEYPCATCKYTIPLNYCGICRDKFEKIQAADREREAARLEHAKARRRARYADTQQFKRRCGPRRYCVVCKAEINAKRSDSKYCSAACRQKAHRQRATAMHEAQP